MVAPALATSTDPEALSLQISRRLKPISDDDWKQIAGDKINEKYSVVKGDTLSEISGRLLGDIKYWPKLWALNNATITNPHFINPGELISFEPGTGIALPSVSLNRQGEGSGDSAGSTRTSVSDVDKMGGNVRRSGEWKSLPKQRWETVTVNLPPEVDASGFDRRSAVTKATSSGLDLDFIAASERLTLLGQIVGARTQGAFFSGHQLAYIRADEDIQLGETYAITQEPLILKARKSDRVGYSYRILGKVKIVGVRDNLFVGNITGGKDAAIRGASLIPLPKRVKTITPVPGPDSLEAVVMLDQTYSTFAAAQHKHVFIDRGTDDGVKPGMVFRAYEHVDPMDSRKVTSSDFIIGCDTMVLQSSERFSVGVVMSGSSTITNGARVVLLIDVSDLNKNKEFRERWAGEDVDKRLDDLEQLDSTGGIGKDEEKELQQLERWKQNPPDSAPPEELIPDGDLPPPPMDSDLPPPMDSDLPPPMDSDLPPPMDSDLPPPPMD